MTCDNTYFNEESSGYIVWTFRDKNKVLSTPTAIEYKIHNKADNTAILTTTAISPASSVEILITSVQNAILDQTLEYEEHVMTITASYGLGDQIVEEAVFKVKNLQFVA